MIEEGKAALMVGEALDRRGGVEETKLGLLYLPAKLDPQPSPKITSPTSPTRGGTIGKTK